MRIIKTLLFLLICTGMVQSVPTNANDAQEDPHQDFIALHLDFSSHWGQWGPQSMCPEGYFAHSFRLKVESEEAADDTAMNAIELSCSSSQAVASLPSFAISSLQGKWGDWRGLRTCSKGFLTGLRMKSEPERGMFIDDTAANDLEMQCNWSSEIHNGGGDHWGDWSSWSNCPQGWAICGLETKVEDETASDDTALNDVKMYCCKLPN